MKKTLLFTFVLSLVYFSVSSSNRKSTKTKTEKYSFSAITNQFSPSSIEVFKYNIGIFDLYKSTQTETDSVPESLTQFQYNGNIVTGTTSNWENNKWNEQIKFTSYLKDETRIDSIIVFSYDSINQAWKPQAKYLYLFEGNLSSKDQIYMADSITGSWGLYMETIYTHNSSGYLTGELTNVYFPELDQWTAMLKDDYYVSASGITDSMISYMWNPSIETWMAGNKTEYFFNNDGTPDYDIDYNWGYISSAWNKSSKSTYLSNESGYIYFEEDLFWDEAASDWAPSSTYTTIYSNETKPLVEENREWIPELGAYIVEEKSFYSYDTPQSAVTNFMENNLYIFPNPAEDFITVKINQPQNANIQFFDLKGKMIFQQNLNSETSIISVAQLKQGNYLTKITNNRKTHSQVLIIK